jgi:hypothetical protein
MSKLKPPACSNELQLQSHWTAAGKNFGDTDEVCNTGNLDNSHADHRIYDELPDHESD